MAKVPENARGNLLTQQLSLLDMVEDVLKGDDTAWREYIYSAFPDFSVIDGKPEPKSAHRGGLWC